jgi:hypothetical protein
MMSWNKIGTQSSHSGNRPMIEGFTPKTTVEANMADRDVFGERIQRDRLPSGLPPMFGILLAVMWWPRGYFWWSSSSPTKGSGLTKRPGVVQPIGSPSQQSLSALTGAATTRGFASQWEGSCQTPRRRAAPAIQPPGTWSPGNEFSRPGSRKRHEKPSSNSIRGFRGRVYRTRVCWPRINYCEKVGKVWNDADKKCVEKQ